MKSRKDRKHSGREEARPTVSKKEMIRYDLNPEQYYDDWKDYRDGMRDRIRDNKTIKDVKSIMDSSDETVSFREKMNLKQKKLSRRRRQQHERTERFI